ncbi:galacturonokinase-like [Punica granatum]|uniref:Galacturonokinase-like n=1 Tax=Punica granatum TaxID=22663 RepID=A0A6P8BVF0_PUNGR|nr:galacturonokinase-like [Punica granatum]
MTINKGILLGFVPSADGEVYLRLEQFKGEVKFRVDEIRRPKNSREASRKNRLNCSSTAKEEWCWGNYARGAQYALQSRGNVLSRVGIAYLLAFESANNLSISPTENIEYDRLIENEYLGLRNGILDQSAILLSSHGCLTYMNCKA